MKTIYLLTVAACAFCMITSCSSDEDNSNSDNIKSVRKERILTIKQSEPDANHVQTRTILKDQGDEGIYASWEMGDKATIYNKSYPAAGYMFVKASSSSKNTNFIGNVNCEQGDILRMFYPEVNNVSSVTDSDNSGNLTLDISSQKGTLEDIQLNYDFCYGEATVTNVTEETATADMGMTENLMAICKFTFKSGNEYVKGINNVKIKGVSLTATYTLSARTTPVLTPIQQGDNVKKRNKKSKAPEFNETEDPAEDNPTSEYINISADNAENCIYVAMFPGITQPTFTVEANGGVYEGELRESNLQAGKYYNVVVNLTRTGDASNADYVEVCGIKWAKGNLQYDPINGGDEGFMENWRIAPTQWHYVGYDVQRKVGNDYNVSQSKDYGIIDNYPLGCIGNEALTETSKKPNVAADIDISGKLYIDYFSVPTQSWDYANLGDNAYYVSYGKYRIPTQAEFNHLVFAASYKFGYYKTSDNNIIYGMLFYDSQNGREESYDIEEFTEDDLNAKLFLPGAFYSSTNNRDRLTGMMANSYKGGVGYYLTSKYSYSTATGYSIKVFEFGRNYYNNAWHTIIQGMHANYSYGMSASSDGDKALFKIRPVLCE